MVSGPGWNYVFSHVVNTVCVPSRGGVRGDGGGGSAAKVVVVLIYRPMGRAGGRRDGGEGG